jgi:hypothetical protein
MPLNKLSGNFQGANILGLSSLFHISLVLWARSCSSLLKAEHQQKNTIHSSSTTNVLKVCKVVLEEKVFFLLCR